MSAQRLQAAKVNRSKSKDLASNTMLRKFVFPVANSQAAVSSKPPSSVFAVPLLINDQEYITQAKDFESFQIIGRGAFGKVYRAVHKPSQTTLAIKKLGYTSAEEKRLVMELELNKIAAPCQYAVRFYGSMICEAEVWICMEIMDLSTDKLYKLLLMHQRFIPEDVLGKIAIAVVKALQYLVKIKIMHRDVKPSNILVSRSGDVKVCDYGISKMLTSSVVTSKGVGSRVYMAPERIDPDCPAYKPVADVWSLGISMIEIASGEFPFIEFKTEFEQLKVIVQNDPPSLDNNRFSIELVSFVKECLVKDYTQRPTYEQLLKHSFITKYENKDVDVAQFVSNAMDDYADDLNKMMET